MELAELCKGIDSFGVQLLSRVAETLPNQNVFMSPYSISTALGMAAAGADGDTLNEFIQGLHLTEVVSKDNPAKCISSAYETLMRSVSDSAESSDMKLKMANAILTVPDYPWHADYMALVQKQFKALTKVVESVPEMLQEVNGWCSSNTEGKINRILSSLDPDTKLVILNAIYFKGLFEHKFDASKTKIEQFYHLDDSTEECNMMYMKGKMHYSNNEKFQVVQLPYKGKQTSLIVALPKEKGNQALKDTVQAFNDRSLFKSFMNTEGQIWLPRFTAECKVDLSSTLPGMGIQKAFSEWDANFSKITPSHKGFHISQVIHQAFVEVNEEGTEAAAATVVTMKTLAMLAPQHPFQMRVDRPFVLAIYHNELGSTLFSGIIHHTK